MLRISSASLRCALDPTSDEVKSVEGSNSLTVKQSIRRCCDAVDAGADRAPLREVDTVRAEHQFRHDRQSRQWPVMAVISSLERGSPEFFARSVSEAPADDVSATA